MAYIIFGGFCMALADSVPGVSGGTVAFILGFYDSFITSLHDLVRGGKDKRIRALKFLMTLGSGWIVGFLLAVSILADMFTSGIYQVSSLFLGFVAASLPLVMVEEKDAIVGHYKNIPFAILGGVVLVLLTNLNFSSMIQDLGLSPFTAFYIIVAGILAISAMVLPGISGSTLLMSFGLYVPVLTAIKQVLHLDFHNLWLLIILAIGIALGVVISLGGIKKMLDSYRSAAMYAILGMMIASLYAIVRGPMTLEEPKPMLGLDNFHIIWFLAGCAAVLSISFINRWREKVTQTSELETMERIEGEDDEDPDSSHNHQ